MKKITFNLMAANDELTAGGESAAMTVASDNEASTNAQSVHSSNETLSSNENQNNNNQPAKTNMEQNFANNEINHAGEAGIVTNPKAEATTEATTESNVDAALDVDKQFRASLHRKANRLSSKDVQIASYQNLMEAGYKFCVLAQNRNINLAHANALRKQAVKDGKFSQPGTAYCAKAVLTRDANVHLTDFGGHKLDLQKTSDLDRYLVVADGQHRLMAIRQAAKTQKLDMDFLIMPAPADISKEIVDMNAYSQNWTVDAFRKQVAYTTGKEDLLKKHSLEAEKIFPNASEKFYAYALTGRRDAIKKNEIVRKKMPPKYEGETGERGKDILRGLAAAFSDNSKAHKIEVLDAIFDIKKDGDDKMPKFAYHVKVCLMSLSGDQKATLTRSLANLDFTQFEDDLKEILTNFYTKTDDEVAAIEKEHDAELQDTLKANAKKVAEKKVKNATFLNAYNA